MAARSEGLFPREGFNLDDENQVTGVAIGSNLYHAKTVRVIVIGGSGDVVVTLGTAGEVITLGDADADQNGVRIGHVRGALCPDEPTGSVCSFTGTATGVWVELVDGVRR